MAINISDNDPRVSYTATSGQTVFAIPFDFFEEADISLYINGTEKTVVTDYTVDTDADGNFLGTATLITAATAGDKVVIVRDVALQRTTDFTAGAAISRAALNEQLDVITAQIADLDDKASRTIQLNDHEVAASVTLPAKDDRKGKYLAFNATSGDVEAGASTDNINSLAAITDDIATLADIEDGTDATDAIQTVASISSDVTTISGISSNVTTVAGISSDVTAVAGDAADIGAVAAKATEIGRLGTTDAIADMNTLGTAAIVADMDALADITSDISSVGDITADVTTVAGISANVTTVAGISANVTTVAGDTTNIGTVATNISDVNTAATNITAIQNASTNAATATTKAAEASTSAATATTKAAEASTSATNAATSETNAATSATAAAASQTAAAASASSAASAYDTFDDRYLGSKTSDPTLDNDSNALVQGALYFNSTENEMRVYDGANWIAASSAGGASMLEYLYIATASQTAFSGSDENSNTLSYTADNIIVIVNGVVLEPTVDYTATDGTTVTLSDAADLNDEVHIIAFKSFTTADMVSATNGGTFGNNITVNGNITVTGTVDGIDVANHTHAFSAITGTPTTISGYGITDAFDGAFSSLTGTPTTISGYGITDAFDGAYSSLTGIPQSLATTDSPTFATLNATTVDLGDWTITESSGVLYFATGGTNKMKLDASGNLTVTGNVTAYGTV